MKSLLKIKKIPVHLTYASTINVIYALKQVKNAKNEHTSYISLTCFLLCEI